MTDKLKPCPFCGGTAQRLTKTPFYNLPQFQGRRAIICMTCHCIVLGNTEEDAEKIWNRRAENVK